MDARCLAYTRVQAALAQQDTQITFAAFALFRTVRGLGQGALVRYSSSRSFRWFLLVWMDVLGCRGCKPCSASFVKPWSYQTTCFRPFASRENTPDERVYSSPLSESRHPHTVPLPKLSSARLVNLEFPISASYHQHALRLSSYLTSSIANYFAARFCWAAKAHHLAAASCHCGI